jgi:glycosyltransferase involved in cell wall biosynthesis
MFTTTVPPVDYIDPWLGPCGERLAALLRGCPRVAYFCEQPSNSTFRYRAYNMIEALKFAEPRASAAWFCYDDQDGLERAVNNADILVLCRSMYDHRLACLTEITRRRRCPILFDVDDLVFDPRYVHLIMDTLAVPVGDEFWTDWFGRAGRHAAALQLCDGAITTNPFLAARIADYSGLHTSVVPNFLNRAQIDLSRRILEGKRASGFARDSRLHIGYFSGTPTHNNDFALVADALAQIMASDPRIVLRVVGFLDLPPVLASYKHRIEVYPLQDFPNLQRLIGETEINLIPLQENTFTNCKSELKWFEAAAVGTISIASPTFTLRNAIRHGETGFLAASHTWESTLRDFLQSFREYPRIACAAAEDAFRCFSPEAQATAIRQALFGSLAESPSQPGDLLAVRHDNLLPLDQRK